MEVNLELVESLVPVFKSLLYDKITKENNDRFQLRLREFISSDYYLKRREIVLGQAKRLDQIRGELSKVNTYWGIIFDKIRKGESIKYYLKVDTDASLRSSFCKKVEWLLSLNYFNKHPDKYTPEQISLLESGLSYEFGLYDEFEKIETFRLSFPHPYERSKFSCDCDWLTSLSSEDFVYYHFTEFESLSIDKIDKNASILLIKLEILKCANISEVYDYIMGIPVMKSVKQELERILYG